jgi:CheY-like chemotaxis protein
MFPLLCGRQQSNHGTERLWRNIAIGGRAKHLPPPVAYLSCTSLWRIQKVEAKTAHLLHVEDDDLCIMGLSRAFKKAKIANPISFAHDGIDALHMLRGSNGRERFPRPYLILLDLNMPRLGGIEFLNELRQDRDLTKSIVFVMTTSGADEDKVDAYNLAVTGYLLKTNPANVFLEATALLDIYWRVVEFPAA